MAMRGIDAVDAFLNALGIGHKQSIRLPTKKIVLVAECGKILEAYICVHPDKDMMAEITSALAGGCAAEPYFVEDAAVDERGELTITRHSSGSI
jgi:hypothetical protein